MFKHEGLFQMTHGNSHSRPISIRMFLPDGTPDGLRILEKSNWTSCGVYFPRSILPDVKKRDEFGRTGVYILVGPADDKGLPTVYIGQGEVVRVRLESHYASKDFWIWAVFFVSKGQSLNRAHVLHLEARLIELATKVKRAKLDNGNVPNPPHLTEADEADVESFLADLLSILPLVGLAIFEKPNAPRRNRTKLVIKAKGVIAEGYESAEGFVVRKGSQAVMSEVKSIHDYLSALRSDLRQKEVLVPEENHLVFPQDYAFSSPSTAAGVVQGRAANGRLDWKYPPGCSLKEIQEAVPTH